MKKLIAKVRRIRMTRWTKLTLGEKIAKVIFSLLKIALIAAVGITLLGVIAAVVISIVVVYAIGMAIAGGFGDASRAYRTGDRYVRFK